MWSPTAIVILKLIRWAPKPSRKWQEQNVSDGLVCMKDVANQKNLFIFTDISIWMRHTILYFRNIQSRKCSNIIKWERERSYQSPGAWIWYLVLQLHIHYIKTMSCTIPYYTNKILIISILIYSLLLQAQGVLAPFWKYHVTP